MEIKSEMHLLETENIGDVFGLLEILEDMGNPVDIATLDDSLDEERTTLLNLLNDAEALGLVNVEDGDASVTQFGTEFLKADLTERKLKLKELLRKIEPFASLIKSFESSESDEMERDDLDDFIAVNFPSEDHEATFRLILTWGRYSKLIDYDADEEILTYLR